MSEIDSLQIQIRASAEDATKGLDALCNSLKKLAKATSSGMGLGSLANQVNKLNDATSKLTSLGVTNLKTTIDALVGLKNLKGVTVSQTIAKSIGDIADASNRFSAEGVTLLREVAPALSSLSTMGNVKISPTIGREISNIMTAASIINVADLGKIAELSNAVSSLANLSSVRISSTIATQIINLGIAAEQLRGIDLSIFGNLAEALHPLSTIGKVTNFVSALTQLKKIPEIVNQLDSATIGQFVQQVQKLANTLEPLASRMQSVAAGFAAFPERIQNVIGMTDKLTNANVRATGSYTDLYSKLRMAYTAVRSVGTVIASWIEKSNDYIENMNLFNVSMGEYARKAQTYAEKVGELMGIDPSTWMRNQGVFMTLATGFGVAGDRAYIMSQNLTQLGYDLASFFNIAVEGEQGSMNKLTSAISGEIEPLRRLGYDLSQARLEAVALELGIKKAFNAMTQAEKSQLRYYAILKQVTVAQGDMARTLNDPANQLRILKAQITQAARALGDVFIPMLNNVLPYLIAAAKAVRFLAAALASLFGGSGSSGAPVAKTAMEGVSSKAADLTDSFDKAGASAKNLKSYLMGFDEINKLPDVSGASGGSGGAGGIGNIGGSDWDWELPTYDFIDGLVDDRIAGIMRKLQPFLDWIQEHLHTILAVVEAIGVAWLEWKIARGLLPNLGLIRKDLTKLLSLAVSVGTITVMASLVYKFDNEYLEDGNIGGLLADGLTTALSGWIVGKVMKGAIPGVDSKFWAAIPIAISAGTTIKAVYDDVVQEGFTTEALVSDIWAAIKGAASGALIGFTIGGPAGAAVGAAVGAAITLSAGAIVSITAYKVHQSASAGAGLWDDIELAVDDIKRVAEGLFEIDVSATVDLVNATISNTDETKAELNTAITTLNSELNLIKIGVDDSPDIYNTMKSQLLGDGSGGIIGQLNALLAQEQNQVKVLMSFVPPTTSDGDTSFSSNLYGLFSSSTTAISGGITELGQRLGGLLIQGAKGKLTEGEKELTLQLTNTLIRVQQALDGGSALNGFYEKTNVLLSDLSRESFTSVMTEYAAQLDILKEAYGASLTEMMQSMNAQYQAAKILLEQATKDGDKEQIELYSGLVSMWEEQIAAFDPDSALKTALDSAMEPARKMVLEALGQIFGKVDLSGITEDGTFLSQWLNTFMTPGDADLQTIDEAANALHTNLMSSMEEKFGSENLKILLSANEVFGINEWDLLTDEVRTEIYNAMVALYGEDKTLAIFQHLGYNMECEVEEGITQALGESQIGQEVANKLEEGVSDVDAPPVEAPVSLKKDEWNTVPQWVESASGDVNPTIQEVGLELEKGVSSVGDWASSPKISGKDTEKTVNLSKGDWVDLPVDSTVTYDIQLKKGWNGSLTNWISNTWSKTFTINLAKGRGVTWNGKIEGTGDATRITFAKGGGFFKSGEMFIAKEAGPELVGRIGNKSAVANEDQIGDAIFKYMDNYGSGGSVDEQALASAIVSGMKAAGIGAVYLNGRNMADAINAETRRSGKPAIVF